MVFYHNIDPVIFSLFGLEIRYYGLMYVIGFIIAYFMITFLVKERKLNLKKEDVENFLFWLIIGVIAGARIFYILFYNLKFYILNPFEAIALWHGGLSFHGGLVGALVVGFIFCKRKKISLLKLADICVIPLAIGLGLGRIGNFLNGELYGRVTDLPFGFKFKDAEGFRHPSQLYESLKNFFIFFVLWFNRNKEHKDGFLFGLFLMLYGLLRFLIEFVREPEIYVGFLTMGQTLSLPLFFIGAYMVWRLR